MQKIQKISTVLLVSLLALTGCQAIKTTIGKRDNGSLDYANAKRLDPIRLPAGQATTPFVALYDVPQAPTQTALPTNSTGTQYQLPAPPKVLR